MNKIYQYRPAYFSGFEQEVGTFDTLDELLSIPFVKNFSKNDKFDKFSSAQNGHYLFAEYWDGIRHSWWCVGWFDDDNDPVIRCLPDLVCYPNGE